MFVSTLLAVTLTKATIQVGRSHRTVTVEIRMDPAIQYHDDDVWCGWGGGGPKLRGHLWAVVTPRGKKQTTTDLSRLLGWHDDAWFFDQPWKLVFTDINRDGRPEFNIGQYGACNGWSYRLLTVAESGSIVLFPAPELYIPSTMASTTGIDPIPHGFRAPRHAFPEGYTCVTFTWSEESEAYVETSKTEGDCP